MSDKKIKTPKKEKPKNLGEMLEEISNFEKMLKGIDNLEEVLGKIDLDEIEKKRRERQDDCSHERVYSFGPTYINGRWEHHGYCCLCCGLQTDANKPIGQYMGQFFNPIELDRVLYQTVP